MAEPDAGGEQINHRHLSRKLLNLLVLQGPSGGSTPAGNSASRQDGPSRICTALQHFDA
jgi:hypothetical protein